MTWNIEGRKENHVDICMNKDVSYHKMNGFERYGFVHNALPDCNFEEIDTTTSFLGKKLSMPLIISGMTGGPKLSGTVNKNLALAAQELGVAMGIGSQRIALEQQEIASFQVRKYAPDIILLANIGAIQLNNGFGIEECRKAVELIDADALVLHLNSMQEVIQQGETNFKDLLQKITRICKHIGCPVIVKEVGFGIDGRTAEKLHRAGVYAVDLAGAGGTSWTAVESYLAESPFDKLGRKFWDWGIPTADCIVMCKYRKIKMIAGGGIRSGIDIAKALALGAHYASIAGPLLKAAIKGPNEVKIALQQLGLELKTVMFGIGAQDIASLRKTDRLTRKS